MQLYFWKGLHLGHSCLLLQTTQCGTYTRRGRCQPISLRGRKYLGMLNCHSPSRASTAGRKLAYLFTPLAASTYHNGPSAASIAHCRVRTGDYLRYLPRPRYLGGRVVGSNKHLQVAVFSLRKALPNRGLHAARTQCMVLYRLQRPVMGAPDLPMAVNMHVETTARLIFCCCGEVMESLGTSSLQYGPRFPLPNHHRLLPGWQHLVIVRRW